MDRYLSGTRLPVLLLAGLLAVVPAQAREVVPLTLNDGTEVDVRVFPASGEVLLLGFACDQGEGLNQETTAEQLAGRGIEVWMPDLLTAYFQPRLPSAIRELPADAVAELVREAHRRSGKPVYLIGSGPASGLVLRGMREVEAAGSTASLVGAVLLYPRLNARPPEPGKEPEFIEAVGKTKLPIVLLEGERTPNRWGLPLLEKRLAAGGSPVYTGLIPGVRGYFFEREDPSDPEQVVTSQLAGVVKASLVNLRRLQQ